MPRDEFYEAALAFAKSKGWDRDELPRGDRGNSRTCPLGLATGDGIRSAGDDFVVLPPLVTTFILRFDQGLYPDLIADDD